MKFNKILSNINTIVGAADSTKSRLVRGGIGVAITKLSHMLITFLISMILARSLGADGYGIYAFVFAVAMALAIPTQFGLPQLVTRETAKADSDKQWALMRGLWRWSMSTGMLASLAIALVVWFLLLIWGGYLEEQKHATLLLALWLIPLINLCSIQGAALTGLRRVVLGQFPQNVLRPGLLLIFILFVLTTSRFQLTPSLTMKFHALAALVALVTCKI